MPTLYALDPNSILEAHAVHIASTTLGVGTFDMAAADMIDIGKYDTVLLAVTNGGGTGTIDVTPKESDAADGGGTAIPSLALSFASVEFVTKHKVIRCAGRKRFLNIEVVVGGAATRPLITVYGFRSMIGVGGPAVGAAHTGPNIETAITPPQVA
ncbi:MAG: hypothetical protein VW239_04790 [Candidatus Nanopelagicales bacterium]